MPCSDGGPSVEQELKTRLDEATRLLCEHFVQIAAPSEELKAWYHRHELEDAKRTRKEREEAALLRHQRRQSLKGDIEYAKQRIEAAEKALKELEK